jgi:hypothetical protein
MAPIYFAAFESVNNAHRTPLAHPEEKLATVSLRPPLRVGRPDRVRGKQLETTTGGPSDEYDLETARKAW